MTKIIRTQRPLQACLKLTPRLAYDSIGLSSTCPAAIGRRFIQISATPGSRVDADNFPLEAQPSYGAGSPDARFEVLGAPFSLLSVSLSASQNLYTRRGTLVGLSGVSENVTSTLSVFEPFRRSLLGIPFLYQKITSATPITALISTKSPITSFVVTHLDGTTDWMVTSKKALLAWTGHTLSVRPTVNRAMSLAHWGDSLISGRGLVALAGKGQVYQVILKAGETYVVHPSNVVAYTVTPNPPLPYRLKTSILRMQVPSLGLGKLVPETKFIIALRDSDTWKRLVWLWHALKTWSRRTIWGDRLFLRFHGPTTLLMQTRAHRISDVLTTRDVDEISDAEPGAVQSVVNLTQKPVSDSPPKSLSKSVPNVPLRLNYVSIERDGKVKLEETGNFKDLAKT
ncbi:MAG: Altered inheritance of mitochondria protein 24, mitochondrial [Vezdaea acicularis]|nr:MAG: Altered inheritance of mitochondria protein 24, mitochondrial [Vezdaea acicularis]